MQELLNDYEMIIQSLRKNIADFAGKFKDPASLDFLNGLMKKHEMSAWIFKRYLS